ncbi:MAG: Bug family tripartite tricarboxylate transporter substrate binding protein [Beijerinckiaceae bacterium]
MKLPTRIRATLGAALTASAFFAAPPLAVAQSVEEFYRGRSVTLIVPTAPGGINDISGRLVARNYSRFIPGNPTFVVQNVPGGGGLVAANRLANTAERDGSVIAIIQRAVPQLAIQGEPNAKFDPSKLTWLGSLSDYEDDAYLVVVNSDHPANVADDLRKPGVRLRLGGDQPGSTNLSFAYLAKNALNLNVDVIRGYPGAAPMFLAMQRGELDGQIIGYNSVRAGQPQLWGDKKVRPLFQFARTKRHPELKDIPTARELTNDPKIIALLDFAEMPFFMALPFVAPPSLPTDRAAALRKGFMDMVKDKEFLAEASKVRLDISPIDGAAVDAIVARAMKTPRDVVELYAKMATPQN